MAPLFIFGFVVGPLIRLGLVASIATALLIYAGVDVFGMLSEAAYDVVGEWLNPF